MGLYDDDEFRQIAKHYDLLVFWASAAEQRSSAQQASSLRVAAPAEQQQRRCRAAAHSYVHAIHS